MALDPTSPRSSIAVAALLVALVPALGGLPASPVRPAPPSPPAGVDRTVGVDISWPECPPTVGIRERRGQGKPLPPATTGFAVLGLTNGPGFHANPCLDDELAYLRAHRIPIALYAMTTYPRPTELLAYGGHGPWPTSTSLGRLSNAGYAQASFNVATMVARNLWAPVVWIDIESYAGFDWTTDRAANAAVVRGVMKGYADAGLRVGFYSSVYMWTRILGRYGPRGLPEWRTVGTAGPAAALAACRGPGFAGGHAVMGQWWDPHKDHDVLCPGYRTAAERRGWFAPG